MSLYPGEPRAVNQKLVLDDVALQNSMAKAIEDAMDDLMFRMKGTHLPAEGRDDRRLLFTAISRGILQYLKDHEVTFLANVSVSGVAGTFDVKNFDLKVTMAQQVTMAQHTAHT